MAKQCQLGHRPLVHLQHAPRRIEIAAGHRFIQGVEKLGLLVFIAKSLLANAVPDHHHAERAPDGDDGEGQVHEVPQHRKDIDFGK